MDAIKILGSLLASGALSGGGSSNGNVLGNILGSALGGGQQQGGMGGMLGSLLGGGQQQGGGGLGGMLGSMLGGGAQQQQGGGLGGMLGSMLGGAGQQQQQGGGGLGDMLGGLMGGGAGGQQAGGVGDLLGSLMGGGQQGGRGGLGDLLGASLGKVAETQNPEAAQVTNNFLEGTDQDALQDQAKVVIRAMINAAKADGKVDPEEQAKILEKLGNDVSPEEAAFVKQEFDAPLDMQAFVNSVPRGMEQQIYLVSLIAIDLDTQEEANYLNQLSQAMNIPNETCNQIHEQVGAPVLYS